MIEKHLKQRMSDKLWIALRHQAVHSLRQSFEDKVILIELVAWNSKSNWIFSI